MRLSPRTNAVALAVALACGFGAHSARARQRADSRRVSPAETKQPSKNTNAAKARAASARQRRERRLALAAVSEAAAAARASDDAYEKVRLLAEAADALWPHDAQAARALLRDAWETTTAPGAVQAFETDDPRFSAADFIETAREVVIRRAAKHDARLAESYMREALALSAAGEGGGAAEEGAGPAGPHDVWRSPSALSMQRLSAAHALLNDGDYKSAAAVAAPVVGEGASRPLLDFIARLRRLDASAADALYLRLIERTRADAAADANDVLLLSTPVISPDLRVSIGADGATYFSPVYRNEAVREEPPALAQQARRAFFDTAAAVLARAAAPRAGASNAGDQTVATYFAIGRLLPFFDHEAPYHSPLLRARMAALSQELGEARRERASAQMNTLSLSPKNSTDPLQNALEGIERARGDEQLDKLRFEAVSQAATQRLWDRARRMAGEIVDAGTRRSALLLIEARQVLGAYEAFEDEKLDDDFERAAAFVRAADVLPAVRAYGYVRAAELAARKGKGTRAAELFGEALAAAAQLNKRSGPRLEVLAALAAASTRVAPARAWELLGELAAAINEVESDPEADDGDACAGFGFNAPDGLTCYSLPAEHAPEPEEVFALIARLDLGRALSAARTLKDDVTRAGFLLAAARGALAKDARGDGGAR